MGFASVSCLGVLIPALLAPLAQAKLNVVATTPDLGALAREIGGDRVEVTTLAKPTEDPHFVDAKPSFIARLNRADALIEGGAELEQAWLTPLLEGARNAKLAAGQPGRIVAAEGVTMLDVPATLDRSKGDLHAAGNPHYLVDPLNGRIVAEHLCRAFCQLDDPSKEVYQANQQKFLARLEAKTDEWEQVLAPFKGRAVVTYHNYWAYFARRFGLVMDLFLEPKPGLPPAPAHLAEVMAKMKKDNIRVVAVQPYLNRKTAETVASRTGATVLDWPSFPGTAKGQETYCAWLDFLVHSLAEALAKK